MSNNSSIVACGVIVTLRGTKDNGCVDCRGKVYDFVSRFFAPWMGVSEDPVTGKSVLSYPIHTTLPSGSVVVQFYPWFKFYFLCFKLIIFKLP